MPVTDDDLGGLAQHLEAIALTHEGQAAQMRLTLEAKEKAELAKRDAQTRYELAIRGSNDGLWEWNLESDIVYLSPRWKSMLGYTDQELGDQAASWKARIHPRDRTTVEAAQAALIHRRSDLYSSEHRLLHKDGTPRWVLSRGTVIRHASGKPHRFIGLDTDITAVKRVEEILTHVAEGTSSVTGNDFFRALVKNFAEILGVSIAFVTECIDYPTTRVRAVAWYDRGQYRDNVEYELQGVPCHRVINEGVPCFHPRGVEQEFPKELGKNRESYYGYPIKDTGGKVIGHLAFFDSKEMDSSILLQSIYRIFAARAATELGRSRLSRIIGKLTTELDHLDPAARLQSLARDFAQLLNVREAIVTQCVEEPQKRLKVLAWWREGKFEQNTEYNLVGTTCEETINEGRICFYPRGVGERFPPAKPFDRESYVGVPCIDSQGRTIGHVACFDNKPIDRDLPETYMLQLFGQRAAVELERRQMTLH